MKDNMLLALISWVGMIIIALIIVGYLRCENIDTRIQECLKAGKPGKECTCAFDHTYNYCAR